MAITFPFCFLWMSLSLDLQDLSCLWWEDNYSWLHFSPLASFKMSNSGSVHDSRFAPWVFCQPQAQARALPPQRQPGRSNVWPLSAHEWARGKLLSPSCHFLEPSSPRLDVQIFDTQNCTFELGEQSCVSGFALLHHLCETDLQTSTPRWGCTRFPQEKALLARWGSFTSFSSGKLQASGYMAMSLWHRNKLNQIFCSHWVGKSPFIQLTAVPSHLPQYLFTDFTLKTSQPQKKFFLERMQHCLGR